MTTIHAPLGTSGGGGVPGSALLAKGTGLTDTLNQSARTLQGLSYLNSAGSLDLTHASLVGTETVSSKEGTAIAGITTDIEGNQLYPPYNIGPYGAAAGSLEAGASDHTGQVKLSFTAVSNPTDTTFADDHTYKLADSHQMRSVTGWTYGTANTFYNADGTPKTLTGAALKAAGVGPLLWIGDSKWLAFKSTVEAKRALKVPVA